MPLQTLVSVVLFLAIASQLNLNCYAAAKGSNQASKKCQQYGHSCLGGHGKRSSPSSSSAFSMQIPLFSNSRVSSLTGPIRSYSAGSPLSSSTEQLYFGGASYRPSSSSSSSHFSSHKFPLVYTLLSSAFPSRKHQLQQQQQQQNWKSFQDSSSNSNPDITDWASAGEQAAAAEYLVPLPPMSSVPTGTDPDGGEVLRGEGLGSTFITSGNNYHRVPNAVAAAAAAHFQSSLKKQAEEAAAEAAAGKQQASEWELPSPMKKATSALARFRRSIFAGAKVGSLQQGVKGGH